MLGWVRKIIGLGALWLVVAAVAGAQVHDCGTTALGTYKWTASGDVPRDNNCQVSGSTGFR